MVRAELAALLSPVLTSSPWEGTKTPLKHHSCRSLMVQNWRWNSWTSSLTTSLPNTLWDRIGEEPVQHLKAKTFADAAKESPTTWNPIIATTSKDFSLAPTAQGNIPCTFA